MSFPKGGLPLNKDSWAVRIPKSPQSVQDSGNRHLARPRLRQPTPIRSPVVTTPHWSFGDINPEVPPGAMELGSQFGHSRSDKPNRKRRPRKAGCSAAGFTLDLRAICGHRLPWLPTLAPITFLTSAHFGTTPQPWPISVQDEHWSIRRGAQVHGVAP